jgi:uncharacterized membrane protein
VGDFIVAASSQIAILIDGAAALIVGLATIEAIVRSVYTYATTPEGKRIKSIQPIRWRLGHWLSLSLEFLIGSDIIRTAVSPTWIQLGQLGGIVVLRVVINYTLGRDIAEASDETIAETPTA